MTTITVTEEHIAEGKPGECNGCPVALAIKDAFPGIADVAVGPCAIGIQLELGGPWAEVEPPGDVALFILLFDGGDGADPFTFDLDLPAVTP